MDDTQYVNLELSLGDLFFEPTLAIERDYNGAWGSSCDHSWNFYGGLGLTVSF